MRISYLKNTSSPVYVSDGSKGTSSVKPRCGEPAGARNIHPVWVPSREVTELGVRVMSTGFDAMAGSVCSVVTDVFCYNGTHKATVLGKD